MAGFLDEFWAAPLARLKATAETPIGHGPRPEESGVKLVAQELVIHTPADQLYELLVDPELFIQWMAEDADARPIPGGTIRWTHANGDTCSGTYVELVPGRRVVFTYGWERAEVRSHPDRPPSRSTSPGRPTAAPCSSSCTADSTTRRRRPPRRLDATTSTGSRAQATRPGPRTRSVHDRPRPHARGARPMTERCTRTEAVLGARRPLLANEPRSPAPR